MMLLLPAQWAWAAAAAYCAHESSSAAEWHIGHHEHGHKTAVTAAAKQGQAAKSGAIDFDCDYCHLSTMHALPAHHDTVLPEVNALAQPEGPLHVGSHIGPGPERPDRALAV